MPRSSNRQRSNLGYRIGSQIYDAYLAGKLAPSGLRRLFLAHLDEPGLARKVCGAVIAKLRAISRSQSQRSPRLIHLVARLRSRQFAPRAVHDVLKC